MRDLKSSQRAQRHGEAAYSLDQLFTSLDQVTATKEPEAGALRAIEGHARIAALNADLWLRDYMCAPGILGFDAFHLSDQRSGMTVMVWTQLPSHSSPLLSRNVWTVMTGIRGKQGLTVWTQSTGPEPAPQLERSEHHVLTPGRALTLGAETIYNSSNHEPERAISLMICGRNPNLSSQTRYDAVTGEAHPYSIRLLA